MATANGREARDNLRQQAFDALTHHRPMKVEEKADGEPRVLKELHIRKLHDGSLHHTVHHENGMRKEGSTHDLDEIHDLLEEHLGEPNSDEQEEHEEHEEHSQQ